MQYHHILTSGEITTGRLNISENRLDSESRTWFEKHSGLRVAVYSSDGYLVKRSVIIDRYKRSSWRFCCGIDTVQQLQPGNAIIIKTRPDDNLEIQITNQIRPQGVNIEVRSAKMSDTSDKQLLTLWKMVIQQIQPREIRISLGEYCNLVEFDALNKIAVINVQHKSVIQIINTRILHLEEAFEAVFRVPVKIRLSSDGAVTESEPSEIPENAGSDNVQIPQFLASVFQTEPIQPSNQGLGAPYT